MYANLVLFKDLLRSSEDILDEKFEGKIYFLGEYWSIKIIIFMEPSVPDKNHCDIYFSFLGIHLIILWLS